MNISIITTLILFFTSASLKAQILNFEQAPSSLKWEQINSENFQLIYPSSFAPSAQKLALQLDHFLYLSSRDLQIKPRKISIILQSTSLEANGFVQLAPRKSEFYSTPPPLPDNQEWLPNLAQHELRHVAQFDKLTGKLKKPFLEQLALLLYGITLPSWYFEGDAVYIETAYSKGGRGRLPSWEMPLKANMLSDKSYSYDKYILGSMKDIVPSYYTAGYYMVSKLRNDFAYDIQEKLFNSIRKKYLYPYNFDRSLKGLTGLNSLALFEESIADLKEIWQSQEQQNPNKLYPIIEPKKSKFFQNWFLPQGTNQGEILAIFRNPQQTSQVIKIEKDSIFTTLFQTGFQLSPYFHYRKNQIVWDEIRRDLRFTKRNYNVINIYDMESKKIKTLSHRSRYFSPILHPLNDEILVLEVDLNNQTHLKILQSTDGKVLKNIPINDSLFLQQPQFNPDGTALIAIAVSSLGTNLIAINLEDQSQKLLLPWSNQQLERPIYSDFEHIIFKAHYNGTDNIYILNSKSGEIKPLTNARFGSFNPSITADKQALLFNDYHYNGYKISRIPLDTAASQTDVTQQDLFSHYYKKGLAKTPEFNYTAAPDSNKQYLATAYKGLHRTLNFHSLSLSANNFDSFDNYRPGLFWLSNNLLNTTQIITGYAYDLELNSGRYSTEIAYQRYFPKFKLRYENNPHRGAARRPGTENSFVNFDYREHLLIAEMTIPMAFYKQNYTYALGFNTGTTYQKRHQIVRTVALNNFREQIKFPLYYQVYFNRNSHLSAMELGPRWGQNISITYRHLPFDPTLQGELFSIRSNFYFPGIQRTHSVQVRLNLQDRSGNFQFNNDIPMVSAFGYFNSKPVDNTLLMQYRFPLAYPDWTIGRLAYIKRLKAGFFADYQNLTDQAIHPKTWGMQVSADLNVLRFYLPNFEVGMRATYINDKSATQKVVPSFTLGYSY